MRENIQKKLNEKKNKEWTKTKEKEAPTTQCVNS